MQIKNRTKRIDKASKAKQITNWNQKVIRCVQTHAGKKGKPAETLPAEGIGYIPVASVTVPSAIEYILVTRWLGGEGRGNRKGYVSDEGERTSNKEEVGVCIRVNRLALPEGGERKRNLTTTGLGEKQRESETGPVPTKSSQSPLRIRSVQIEGVKELGSEEVTSNEVPMAIQGEAQPGEGKPM